jgi:hypothetical protein
MTCERLTPSQVLPNSPPEAARPGSGTNDIYSPRKPAHVQVPASSKSCATEMLLHPL